MSATCPHCGKPIVAPPARRGGLTSRQQALLDFIQSRLDAGSVTPSYAEMTDALDLRSKSDVYRLVNELEERGRIRRLPNRARSIEIVGQGA